MKIDGSKVKGTEGWNKSFFEQVGLLDLSQNDWKKIGSKILVPGCSAGTGLSIRTAKEFGLNPGTPVGTSIIDCYAGGLGLIGCNVEGIDPDFQTRLSKYLFIFNAISTLNLLFFRFDMWYFNMSHSSF